MRRNQLSVLLALSVSASAVACDGDSPGELDGTSFRGSVLVGDTARAFVAYVPNSLDGSSQAPLLVAFHGSGGSGAGFRAFAGLDRQADAHGFIAVYPDALVSNWAEGCDCNNADRLGINDLGLADALIDEFSSLYAIDPRRVYAVGFSQGGLFVHRLACERAGRFAAVASVAAPISFPLSERCAPSAPVSVLGMQGSEDAVFPWEGGGQGSLAVLGAVETIERWASRNECGTPPSVTRLPDTANDGTHVIESLYSPCGGGTEVALYAVMGGVHTWEMSRDIGTAEVLLDFLLDQTGAPAPQPDAYTSDHR